MLALVIERLAIEDGLEDLHDLDGAGIARRRRHGLARHVRRDDVDRQPPFGNPVERRDLPRQLRRPGFADPYRHQQPDAPGQRRDRPCKNRRVDAKRIARGQQHIVEAALFGGEHDVAAMLPARFQRRIGQPQKFIIIIAQRRKPADFTRARGLTGGANTRNAHGRFSPSEATSTPYHSARDHSTL